MKLNVLEADGCGFNARLRSLTAGELSSVPEPLCVCFLVGKRGVKTKSTPRAVLRMT